MPQIALVKLLSSMHWALVRLFSVSVICGDTSRSVSLAQASKSLHGGFSMFEYFCFVRIMIGNPASRARFFYSFLSWANAWSHYHIALFG